MSGTIPTEEDHSELPELETLLEHVFLLSTVTIYSQRLSSPDSWTTWKQ